MDGTSHLQLFVLVCVVMRGAFGYELAEHGGGGVGSPIQLNGYVSPTAVESSPPPTGYDSPTVELPQTTAGYDSPTVEPPPTPGYDSPTVEPPNVRRGSPTEESPPDNSVYY